MFCEWPGATTVLPPRSRALSARGAVFCFEPFGGQRSPEIRLQPDDFPFARSSRLGWRGRLPPNWAFALAFLIWMLALSGTYFLEPSLTP